MNKQQNTILWIGLALVMLFLFTDANFRNTIFGRNQSGPAGSAGAAAGAAGKAAANGALSIFGGLPVNVGNTHSNTGNSGSAQIA